MHVILTGATGNVGAPLLRYCLGSPKVTQLSILSRREFALPQGDGLDASKARVIVHSDYASYPGDLTDKLRGAEACIWAQGVSQNDVSKEDYIRITYDYPIAAAKSFASLSNSGKFNFVYVSGEGADPTEKTYTLFGKIKGRAERTLLGLSLPSLNVYNVRPGLVTPPHPDRPRSAAKKVFIDGLMRPLFGAVAPGLVTPVGELSKVLVDLATGDGKPLPAGEGIEAGGRTVRSSAIRRLGKE
ncbi:hypothetical protein GLOTRDRAFT_40087 [Gloeophyllum trabeum ATCC 11539]|uniref:NAD(P)-binding domain-containing protein n=1 Tax=Gloeophyllum trabeum (strain ATCC 11539 / FP-39264 / Madison 617) TaxID=670483 RepID=S7RP26_GLOTA|nr:uncharacterized protein GLOTRDRAFT_40087 [Gloeophyllum trabeum ATCC 11539]EPQ56295.1 hypothetical protein GLOTRDRAFT_40087 [Gloeophyllum trabeum ATCC 11539]